MGSSSWPPAGRSGCGWPSHIRSKVPADVSIEVCSLADGCPPAPGPNRSRTPVPAAQSTGAKSEKKAGPFQSGTASKVSCTVRELARVPAGQGGPVRREGHHRDQPGVRHEMRVVERRAGPGGGVRQSHLESVLSSRADGSFATPILPAQRALLTLTRPKEPLPDRWIQAKGPARPPEPLRAPTSAPHQACAAARLEH